MHALSLPCKGITNERSSHPYSSCVTGSSVSWEGTSYPRSVWSWWSGQETAFHPVYHRNRKVRQGQGPHSLWAPPCVLAAFHALCSPPWEATCCYSPLRDSGSEPRSAARSQKSGKLMWQVQRDFRMFRKPGHTNKSKDWPFSQHWNCVHLEENWHHSACLHSDCWGERVHLQWSSEGSGLVRASSCGFSPCEVEELLSQATGRSFHSEAHTETCCWD